MASYLNSSASISNKTADSLFCRLDLAVSSLAAAGNLSSSTEALAISAVTSSLAKVDITVTRAESLASVLSTLSSTPTAAASKATKSKSASKAILTAVESLTSAVASQAGTVTQTLGNTIMATLGGLVSTRGIVGPSQGSSQASSSTCLVRGSLL